MLGTVHVPVAPDSCDSPMGWHCVGHTSHLQWVLQELYTPNSGTSPQFLLPLDNETAPGKHLPKTPWHQ